MEKGMSDLPRRHRYETIDIGEMPNQLLSSPFWCCRRADILSGSA